MPLPFENPQDRNARKWTCFVCAHQYKSFEQYCYHITEEHEEGRDYVVCGVEHCKAPVRDLAMHYKAQHKGEQTPPIKQAKAILWRDPNPRNGKMDVKKPNFRKGWYVSSKTGKAHYYRSGWEERVYEMLDTMPEVLGFNAEPLQIEYWYDGEMRRYTPDIIILFVDGHRELWEIKPSNQTSLEINECKWAAAKQYCESHGWHFQVITEQTISQMQNYARNRLTAP